MSHADKLSAAIVRRDLPRPPSTHPRVLVIDADMAMAARLEQAVAGDHLRFEQTASGAQGLRRLAAGGVDLVLLELDLPGVNGLDYLRQVRQTANAPIIVVTARAAKLAAVLCLELGADDFVQKPADADELNARIRAVLRRANPEEAMAIQPAPGFGEPARAFEPGIVEFAGWRFDPAGLNLWDPSRRLVPLTATEADVLRVLVAQARQPLSRGEINALMRRDSATYDDRRIDVLVKKIRAKIAALAPDLSAIKSIRGVGYMFCLETRQVS